MTIEINNLSKVFGKKQALNNVSLNIEKGMYGLLGRNGAGKTTLMRILTTLTTKSSGEVKMQGIDISDKKNIRRLIGYLPQDFAVYPNLTVYEAMDYIGMLCNINTKNRKVIISKLLKKVNLDEQRNVKFKALSGGMKRRLGIAQALINDPRILIVDEPTAGLDPEERVRFRNLLSEFSEDKVVILSTHIVGDIEATCKNVGILDNGNLIFNGSVDSLLKEAEGKIYSIEINKHEYEEIREKYKVISVISEGENLKIRIAANDMPYENAKVLDPTIEDAYMFIIGGESNA